MRLSVYNSSQLQELNIEDLELIYLNIASTGIQTINYGNNNTIRELNISSTQIDSINDGLQDLQRISCTSTNINILDLNGSADLQYVSCGQSNYLEQIKISNCESITELNCYGAPNLTYISCRAINQSVANTIANLISNAASSSGVVYTDNDDTYYSTIADAATAKGWTIEQL